MKCSKEIDYYITKAAFLSKPFEQQYRELYMLGDYITDDIANDWLEEDISLLEKLAKEGVVGADAVKYYQQILKNFSDVSLGGTSYDDTIWSLNGLRTHDFWNCQRNLAEKLLTELNSK